MDRFCRYRTILFSLLVLGVALRVRQYAACPSYWYDEAYLLLNIFHRSFLELLGPLRENQAAPPLFLGMLRALYSIAGGSEWAMRLPALAASVAGLLAMVPLARRIGGRRGGLWAVAFCALGHHAAAHAGEVKPYTVDFLMTELILLAAVRCLQPIRTWRSQTALCLLAVLAPWASYPAAFVLGAASLALLVHALRRGERSSLVLWAISTSLFALSGLVLWQTVARHQMTPGLRAFWSSSFFDLSSPGAAVGWLVRCLIEIGNYGTREMGLPLLVLAFVGAASLWHRSPSRFVLLLGPLALALIASALRRYPLGGRLVFFLVPCVWLLAARGIGISIHYLPARRRWLSWVLPAVLLIPAVWWAGRLLMVVTPRCQFREAFAYVERHRRAGDVLWVSHPQVYEVYYGRKPVLSPYSPPRRVERAAYAGRLWMVCAVAGSRDRLTAPEMVARVRAAPCEVLDHQRFKGLEVILYTPKRSSFISTNSPGKVRVRRVAKCLVTKSVNGYACEGGRSLAFEVLDWRCRCLWSCSQEPTSRSPSTPCSDCPSPPRSTRSAKNLRFSRRFGAVRQRRTQVGRFPTMRSSRGRRHGLGNSLDGARCRRLGTNRANGSHPQPKCGGVAARRTAWIGRGTGSFSPDRANL